MDKSENLIFFNSSGYPYNFKYNDIAQQWEGKMMFDENSSEIFESLSLYIFEKVNEMEFDINLTFDSSQLFNWSGMTFIPSTYSDLTVTNIERVNSNSNFYTKWIYGNDFDSKFPKGTVISFTGDTSGLSSYGWSDFITSDQSYFNVIGTKKGAIMISTKTSNDIFTGFTFQTGSTLKSHNIIRVNELNDSNLVNLSDLGYYSGKKLTISNSFNNDGVYEYISGRTYKNSVYDFDLSSETTGVLNLDITLYTERPVVYSGDVYVNISDNSISGTTIKFLNNLNSNIEYVDSGQTIIFETQDGSPVLSSNPTFTIYSFKDTEWISNNQCTFYIINNRFFIHVNDPSLSGITTFDEIYFEANPYTSGQTFNHKRRFNIVDITNTETIEVDQYIIPETGNTYILYKVLKPSEIDTIYCGQTSYPSTTGFTGYANCYLTTNTISISQNILLSGTSDYYYENTINSINSVYGNYLNSNGIELYHMNYSGTNYLIVQGLYDYIESTYFNVSADINSSSLSSSITPSMSSSSVHYFEVVENLSYEKTNIYDLDSLNRSYSAEIDFDLNDDLLSYGFKINFNGADYFINYSTTSGTTSYTYETISNFIDKYNHVFNGLGFSLGVYVSGTINTMTITSNYPNIDVYNLDIYVNIFSSYEKRETKNDGIVISSNEVHAVYADFYDMEMSTGMIISISGSDYWLNNKDYNILGVSQSTLQLSYQGPFFDESGKTYTMYVREFLRKPRSYYNKNIDYKFSWVAPETGAIPKEIFYYDFSGDKLTPYNNISNLTYTGVKPLIDGNTPVFLNKEPNKFDSEVNNPSMQQTIFDNIVWRLETLDSSDSYDYTPVPMDIHIGFNYNGEGVIMNEMKIEKIEYITLSGNTYTNDYGSGQTYEHFIISGETIEYLTRNRLFNFNDYGFETGQIISIDFYDTSNTGQTLYTNYGYYRIKNLTSNKIFIDMDYQESILNYFNTQEQLNYSGKTFSYVLNVEPKEILRCKIYGQSEIEDDRLDILLRNLGIDVYKESEFIFKESDIKETSIDYRRLNRKRKEMLTIYPDIFNYVGSYKSLIHAIDFFGYNDLQLYEYYRNIKTDSPLYGKLHKMLIPDIFDNTVQGWNPIDYIQEKYDKGYYKKTNLFNLTYRITDTYGNYVQHYSLEEVQIKLMSLVKWLRSNIIPLSSNIRDITGVADVINDIYLRHDSSNWVTSVPVLDESVGVNFQYSSTLIDITTYLMKIDFYVLSGYTSPDFFTGKIRTFSLGKDKELVPQQNFVIFKNDMTSFTFTLNSELDPYIMIEISTHNGYGSGYVNSKMFKFDESKNYYLVNKNFNLSSYSYVNSSDGYYILDDGRYYLIRS